MNSEVISEIVDCSRCGYTHRNILAKKFVRPPDGFTHWARCPCTGDPILIQAAR